jgi:hydrogenase expression/formation protein HypE
MAEIISLAHGSGGEASRELVRRIVEGFLKNDIVEQLDDSAVLGDAETRLAVTTDSYVIDPIFFPGGDIGSLAVHGTVNDLSMVGATPLGLTLALIIEEGFAAGDLDRILGSVQRASAECCVPVVGGDTKVVERGAVDGIFINTSGVGTVPAGICITGSGARPGDIVILSGSIGDHGIAVLSRRKGLEFQTELRSDSAPLNHMVEAMLAITGSIHAMRDPTRGGLATVLNEIAERSDVEIVIDEESVPVKPEVRHAADMLGLDPFYVANEGKLVAFVPEIEAEGVLEAMRGSRYGGDAAIIGRVTDDEPAMVVLDTTVGGRRILSPLSGELLPRIC